MTERAGQKLGNYRLVRLLGQGGFADVYLAEHIHLKSLAAIKILGTRLTDELRESFLNEARILAHLTHPHIIRTLEFGLESEGIPFLVMDYAPHGTLRQRHPSHTKVPLPTVVEYLKQIGDGLQYAHDRRLIHRDLKPENVLVGHNNELLLSDFGVAMISQTTTRSQTAEKGIVGTMAYMAPEQLQGKPLLASDQYGLGVMVYEWLCGTRPFQGTVVEVFNQHLSVPPAPLRQHVPELSPLVEQVVLTALAKDHHQRFPNVKAFATALEQAYLVDASTLIDNIFDNPPARSALLDPPAIAPGMQSTVVPSGMQSSAILSGIQSTIVPPGVQSTVIASGVQSTVVPSGMQSSAIPSGVQSTVIPSGMMQSTVISPGVQSTVLGPVPSSTVITSSGMQSTAITPPGVLPTVVTPGMPPTMIAPAPPAAGDIATPVNTPVPASWWNGPALFSPSASNNVTTAPDFQAPLSPISQPVPLEMIDRPVPLRKWPSPRNMLLIGLALLVILGAGAFAISAWRGHGNPGVAGGHNSGILGNASNNGGSSFGNGSDNNGSGNNGPGNNGPKNNGSGNNGSGNGGPGKNSPGNTPTSGPTSVSPTATPTATPVPPKPTATPTPKPGCTVYEWEMHPDGGTTGGDVFTVTSYCGGCVYEEPAASLAYPTQVRIYTTGGTYSSWENFTPGVWDQMLCGLSAGTQFKIQARNSGSANAYTAYGYVKY